MNTRTETLAYRTPLSVFSVALMATLVSGLSACSGEESTAVAETMPADGTTTPDGGNTNVDQPSDETQNESAGDLCGDLLSLVSSEVPVSVCDEAIAQDCERIVGTLNDPYVAAVEQCIVDGGDPIACMADSVDAFDKTPAHDALAAAFCDDCALDAPGCEDLFYVDDSEWGLGTLLLPFSDEVLDAIRTECTADFFCAVELPSCARDVIAARLHVDASRECLMDEVL